MAKTPERELLLTDNYGNKAAETTFTTFRGQDKLYRVGDVHLVFIKGSPGQPRIFMGRFRITAIEFKRIRIVSASEIIKDLGRRRSLPDPQGSFYRLMSFFYSKKSWWDGRDTVLQKIYLEKIEE